MQNDKLMQYNRKTKDNQILHIRKRRIFNGGVLLGLALVVVLALAACTGSGAAATGDSTSPTNTLTPSSTNVGGTVLPISNLAIDPLTADDIVAAQETVLGDIYDASLPSVVQIRITQRVDGISPDSRFDFFGGRSGGTARSTRREPG